MHASAETRVAAASSFCALEMAEVIAAQFEFSDDEIDKCVQRFLRQMGMYSPASSRDFKGALSHHCRRGITRKKANYVSNTHIRHSSRQWQGKGKHMVLFGHNLNYFN